jgi:putative heme iron utilization protein
MRQEHVTLKNVEVERLFELIKKHLVQELKLDIIHEETAAPTASTASGYWNLKAHKGSKGSIVVGNIRDVEIMISGTKGNYDRF